MKKCFSRIFVVTVLSLAISSFFSLSSVSAETAPNLSVESISVTRPSVSNCVYQWIATIKNNGTDTISGNQLTAQAYQGNSGGAWQPASGTSLSGSMGPNQTQNSSAKVFVRLSDKNQLKVQIYFSGSMIAEKIVDLPAEAAPAVEITTCNLVSNGTYTATVRNLLSESTPGLTVQGYTANSTAPNNWVAGGGRLVECLSANGTYQHVGPKPTGNEIVKIQVLKGHTMVVERIFNLATPSSGQGIALNTANKNTDKIINRDGLTTKSSSRTSR